MRNIVAMLFKKYINFRYPKKWIKRGFNFCGENSIHNNEL